MLRTIHLPNMSRDETPERIQEWLRDRGIADADVVSTRFIPQTGYLFVRVEAATDPTGTLLAYAPTASKREVRRAQLLSEAKALVRQIRDKGPANWTNQDKIILGICIALQEFAQDAE